MANAFGYSWGTRSLRIKVDGREESDLGLALQGRLEEVVNDGRREIGKAFVRAAHKVAAQGKAKLRADIAGGGFTNGAKLSKTWRGKGFPAAGVSALDPAVQFETKARTIIDAFQAGATIRVNRAKYLAIPLGPAKAIVRKMNRQAGRENGIFNDLRFTGFGRDDNGQYTEQGNPVARVSRWLAVKLVPVLSPDGRHGVLIGESNVTLTPTGRLAKRQHGRGTPLFALVKQATLKKRIRGRAVLNEIAASFEGDFARALMAELPAAYR